MNLTLDMDLLKKQNEEHEKTFNEFHKCVFRQMTKEAIKMAVEILLEEGKYPTDTKFEEKSNNLVKIIIEKFFDMLGSYLR